MEPNRFEYTYSNGRISNIKKWDSAVSGEGNLIYEIKYTYDASGRITMIEKDGAGGVVLSRRNFTYNTSGLPSVVGYTEGV